MIFIRLSLAFNNASFAFVISLLIMNTNIPIMTMIPNPAKNETPIKLYNINMPIPSWNGIKRTEVV